MSYNKIEDGNEINLNSDTIKIDTKQIEKVLRKRKVFTNNKAFPWMSIGLILVYVLVYIFTLEGSVNLVDVDLNNLADRVVFNGSYILEGNFIGLVSNVFVHRSLWDLVNTLFVIVFCGFFIEKYVKRRVILLTYALSLILFDLINVFVFPQELYLGSFTLVSFLIGMCIYFSYRFKRFVLTIDIYIYIALTFIGIFVSYMAIFYNVFQFLGSYLIGVFVIFILDTKSLREYIVK